MDNLGKGLVLALMLALGAGCGSARDVQDYTPVPQAPDYQSISGSIQGLEGILVLDRGTQSQVLTNGDFNVPLAFDSGDSFDLAIISEPFSQRCTIDSETAFVDQTDNVVGVAITCITLNLIRISVVNFATGAPLPGIDVTATWDDQGSQQNLAGVSDAEGLLTFEVPTFNGRIVVNADPLNFGEQSKIVTNTLIPAGRTARMLMQPLLLGTTFDSTAGTSLTVGADVLLTIPADALVDASDNMYNGTVTTELTAVDPSLDVELMPGDYLSTDGAGTTSPIQSYGALSVTFTGAGGEVLNLATGQTADIFIPVAQAELFNEPASTPLFYYDPVTGYWNEEGHADLVTLPSGLRVFAGQVSHFTTWNADEEYVPVLITGCVVNSFGSPFGNVRVDGTGATYLGSSRAISDANGNFALPVRPLSDVLITVGDGLQSGTIQVYSGSAGTSVAECLVASAGSSTLNLTWGQDPSDLDTRFYGFSSVDSGDDFAVNYTQRSVTVNNIDVELDVDDTSGFGPEIVTIPDFPFPGVFRYAVHLFSGDGTIASSPARVELNLRGDITVFTPPPGTPSLCWAVLDITVDLTGNVTLTPLNAWTSESYCNSGDFPNPTL